MFIFSRLFTSNMSTMPMPNVFRMVCLSIILDLHDSTTIVTISMIDDMLDPPIRKVYIVLSLNITSFITRSFFSKVCVILVIMHSILEVERIRLLIVMISTMSSNTSTNTSSRARQTQGWYSKKTNDKGQSNHCFASMS